MIHLVTSRLAGSGGERQVVPARQLGPFAAPRTVGSWASGPLGVRAVHAPRGAGVL